MDSYKAARLNKLFNAIVTGRIPLNESNHLQFLESISTSDEPVGRFHAIVTNPKGLVSLQGSLWINISPRFLNNAAAKLLQTIKSPSLASTSGGSHLRKIVQAIVEPPIFWDAFVDALKTNQLEPDAQASFAWLLLQLVTLSPDMAKQYAPLANDPSIIGVLSNSTQPEVDVTLKKIGRALATSSPSTITGAPDAPGGRHSNDQSDFRDILILPTVDELAVTSERTFLRPSYCLDDPITEPNRVSIHLDNQFRLLREDMLHEMRDELQLAVGKKQGKHRGFVIEGLTPLDMYCKNSDERAKECMWALTFQCKSDLSQFKECKNMKERRDYVNDHPRFLKHQSLTCLFIEGQVVAFPSVIRDEALLVRYPPILVLRFCGKQSINVLLQLPHAKNLKLIQVDTAVFSYEPVLTALQEKTSLPLDREILFFKEGVLLAPPTHCPSSVIEAIRASPKQNLQALIQTPKPITLDPAQEKALIHGLSQRLALIQGPPGTGKSFVGALCAKLLLQQPDVKILVNCYTNHALDQFLEDLMDIGIPEADMVRIGWKSTPRTAPLSLQTLARSTEARATRNWREIDALRSRQVALSGALMTAYTAYKQSNPNHAAVMEHLVFEHPDYAIAFTVPASSDNSTVVGRGGKAVDSSYLLKRWVLGQDAGVYKASPNIKDASNIWKTDRATRKRAFDAWKRAMLQDQAEHIYDLGKQHDDCVAQMTAKFHSGDEWVLQNRRVIGCTTTGAAIHRDLIRAARPSVLLVEEAGEILESHVLTALSDGIEHLILIGDHKQLRPKVNNYYLTVEKGEGFDLNRSLFERLVLKGYPHEQLKAQHRMRPEISRLIRRLTYPDLVDAPKAENRPDIRGLLDNVILIHHEQPEGDVQADEKKDMGSKTSKQNPFEVQMILKIVRYLGQQGYGTNNLVILTPYLGQLRSIMEALKEDNDPVLNDLDSFDLVRAGLLSESAAKSSKKQIRVATIDNYQGEESDIVVASLTRSNQTHDIGFMFAPERVNVLLSRARNGLIMIGNTQTFTKSRKGGELWTTLVSMLKEKGNLYDGLPVVCGKHPNRRSLLKKPDDFDKDCPDGGCTLPCGIMLACGQHLCPSKCHPLADHSKMQCDMVKNKKCPNGHVQQWKCSKGPPGSCSKCDRERVLAEKKQQEQFALQMKIDAEEQAHARQMAELDAQLVREREQARVTRQAEERKRALEQKRLDVQAAMSQAYSAVPPSPPVPSTPANPPTQTNSILQSISSILPSWVAGASPSGPTSGPTSSTQPNSSGNAPSAPKVMVPKPSAAWDDWQYQKSVNGVQSPAIDAIMSMTGLEDVKKQVLSIRNKVDTSIRQGTDLKGERFNVSMLGNPGTGKTTVARHYAKFLASLQVIPSDTFFETTGSRLANDGVPGIKDQVEKMLAAGGGTIFVDEAYQLTSDSSGKRVLDFILAEMENNIGKLVWIFAGYNREMEKFFEHNPGLQSRVPYTLQFKDYEDVELLSMLLDLVEKQWNGRMKVEDGILGLYGRIAVRRLGRGRGRNGFGNARALRNLFDKIRERQSERLAKERRAGRRPDDLQLVKEDLIGPEPSTVMAQSKAWKTLQSMIGLDSVKKSVQNLFDMTISNYKRELQELEPDAVSLNRVFLGSPGTGKTTVAKHYGQILAELGLLSNGEVVTKNPADFIGNVLGQSETNTKAILATTVGKVLIIDEAYMLYSGGADRGGHTDSFKTAVIDTLVAEVQSVPGEDRCVLLLGYKEQMEEMFQNVNPGLARRFSIENAFHFQDYSDSELLQALDLKLKTQDRTATDEAKKVALEVLGHLRIRPNFGNIGEVENLLGRARTNYQDRQSSIPVHQRHHNAPFEPQDFDPDFDRDKNASSNLSKLFEDLIGAEEIIENLRRWQTMAKVLKERGMDMQNIPTNFVFKGPPGVGKTTVARKMGSVYYDMGILASNEVIECSASDLVGQYVGQTGPKTKKLFEKALGRVLFIDEAYRLGVGHFAQEAMDELVGLLTHERFRGKLIVILAGYDQEINNLLQINTGLSSRFPEEILFQNIDPAKCLEILDRKLQKQNVQLPILRDPSSPIHAQLVSLVDQLSELPSWGNARDMETLAKKMVGIALSGGGATTLGVFQLSDQDVLACFDTMLLQRRDRITNRKLNSNKPSKQDVLYSDPTPPPPPPAPVSSHAASRAETKPTDNSQEESQKSAEESQKSVEESQKSAEDGIARDSGVEDDVWEQLQRDKQTAKDEKRRAEEKMAADAEEERKAAEEVRRISNALKRKREYDSKMQELQRRREDARLREQQARAAKEAERKRLEVEARAQTKLREMGRCVAGFQWIKQPQGYRCAGGSHFVGNHELGI